MLHWNLSRCSWAWTLCACRVFLLLNGFEHSSHNIVLPPCVVRMCSARSYLELYCMEHVSHVYLCFKCTVRLCRSRLDLWFDTYSHWSQLNWLCTNCTCPDVPAAGSAYPGLFWSPPSSVPTSIVIDRSLSSKLISSMALKKSSQNWSIIVTKLKHNRHKTETNDFESSHKSKYFSRLLKLLFLISNGRKSEK